MKKKYFYIILIALVGFFLLLMIYKSSQNKKGNSPISISILYNEREENPFKDDWLILQEYKERQSVILDVLIGDDSDYEKTISRIIDIGEIPDVILKVFPESIEKYAANGLFLPISDYEYLMPYFSNYIKENNLENEIDKLKFENGKFYILPGYQRQIQVQQWIYRKDLFEKHNLEIPNTYDELFNSLVYLKEIYPDSKPISASWGGAHLFSMMGAGYHIPAGWSGTRFYDKDSNQWKFAPATDNFKELNIFLNRCYKAEILDPDLFLQSEDEFYTKIQDGRTFVTVTWITSGFDNWNSKLKENGISDGEWAPFAVPESTIGFRSLPSVNPFRKGLVISANVKNNPNFEKIIQFIDWAVYSEEGMTLSTWGIEGLTFINTEDGKIFLPNIQTPKNINGEINITKEYGINTFFNLNENKEYEDFKKPQEINNFLKESLNRNETLDIYPNLILDQNSIEAIRLLEENIIPFVNEKSFLFITGELNFGEDWEKYILDIENYGYKTLEEIWNASWTKHNNQKQ